MIQSQFLHLCFAVQMSKFFERYEDAMPMNPAVMRLTKLVVFMSFAAHLAVS